MDYKFTIACSGSLVRSRSLFATIQLNVRLLTAVGRRFESWTAENYELKWDKGNLWENGQKSYLFGFFKESVLYVIFAQSLSRLSISLSIWRASFLSFRSSWSLNLTTSSLLIFSQADWHRSISIFLLLSVTQSSWNIFFIINSHSNTSLWLTARCVLGLGAVDVLIFIILHSQYYYNFIIFYIQIYYYEHFDSNCI